MEHDPNLIRQAFAVASHQGTADVPHTFVVEGNTPARMLTLITPGGGEGFFVEAGRPAEGDGLPPPAALDIALLKRISAQFGSDIVGPPMAPTKGQPPTT